MSVLKWFLCFFLFLVFALPVSAQIVPRQLPKKNVKSQTIETTPVIEPEKPAVEVIAPPEKIQSEAIVLAPTYLKHRLMLQYRQHSSATTWSYQNRDVDYNSSFPGLGIGYDFLFSPEMKLSFVASQSKEEKDSSDVVVENYGLALSRCWEVNENFGIRVCPGLAIQQDSSAVLDFDRDSSLKLSRVTETAYGAHLGYQAPLVFDLLFNAKFGYLMTAKQSKMAVVDGGLEWGFLGRSALQIGVEYKSREVSETWESKSVSTSGYLSYLYSF